MKDYPVTTFQRDLEDGLRRLVGEVDPDPSRQRLIGLIQASGETEPGRGMRRHRRSIGIAVAGAAATVAAVTALNVAGIPNGSDPASAPSTSALSTPDVVADGPAGVVQPGEPCPIATPMPTDLRAIQREVTVPVWVPLREPITRAWMCGDTPVLMFDDVQVSYEAGWSEVDVPEKFRLLAADFGGRVEQIGSHPALVRPSSEEGRSNQVMLVHGDTLVRLLALDSVPIERLVTLAASTPIPPLG